jgi:D-glycero-D-manno-heptose 1,7-bisphosphate phosphatase
VSRGAVFLDRDGTIMTDVHFPRSTDQVHLMHGAGEAIRRLNDAKWLVIVVTNQSGIARGLLTYEDYDSVRNHMEALLSTGGARIDASYMCPHHPDFTGACECRKPGTLLFRRAAKDHDLDTSASWFVGNRLRDVSPARALGGHGILVPAASTPPDEIAAAEREFSVATSLDDAVTRIIESGP